MRPNNVMRSQNICRQKMVRWVARLLVALGLSAPATSDATVIEDIPSVAASSEEHERDRLNESSYVGDRISLNFQSIEVRAALQLIADVTNLNLVASDSVTGSITLRLQNIPWDQALELVLKTRGLDSRQIGNVLMVAPAQEIAERERQEARVGQRALAAVRREEVARRDRSAGDVTPSVSEAA